MYFIHSIQYNIYNNNNYPIFFLKMIFFEFYRLRIAASYIVNIVYYIQLYGSCYAKSLKIVYYEKNRDNENIKINLPNVFTTKETLK